jgi:hypothetical protein
MDRGEKQHAACSETFSNFKIFRWLRAIKNFNIQGLNISKEYGNSEKTTRCVLMNVKQARLKLIQLLGEKCAMCREVNLNYMTLGFDNTKAQVSKQANNMITHAGKLDTMDTLPAVGYKV